MPGFDVYGHLTFARCLAEQKVGPFGPIKLNIKNSIILHNPFMWNMIVAKLALHKKLIYQKYFNLCTEIVLLIPIISIIISSFNYTYSVLSLCIYFLCPCSFTSLTIGPRLHEFTPRLFTELVLNILILLLYLDLNNIYSSFCILVLSFIVVSSSKFGLQVIFLIIFPIVLITQQYMNLMIILIGSFILPYCLYRKEFIKSITHHMKHLITYFQKVINRQIFIHSRNRIILDTKSKKGFFISLLELIKKNAFLSLIVKYPVVIATIFVLFSNFESYDYIDKVFLILPFVIYLFSSTKYFLFLGESERYLNNVIFIYILFCCKYLSYNTILFILCYGILYKFCESLFYVKRRFNKGLHDEVFAFLKNIHISNIVFYPYQAAGGVWRALLQTNHKVVFPMLQEGASRYEKKYPYIDLTKLGDLISKYNVNIIVIDKKKYTSNYDDNIKNFKIAFENKIFKIIVSNEFK